MCHGANLYAENVTASNVESVYAKSEPLGMTQNDSPPAQLKRLRERSGLSMAALAKALGLKGASSYQRYEDDSLFKKDELPLHLVRELVKTLVGKGSPPITRGEILRLAGLDNLSATQLRSMEDQNVIWCTWRSCSRRVARGIRVASR